MANIDKKPIHCALAYNSVSVNSRGEYLPCCGIQPLQWSSNTLTNLRPKEKINSDDLRELRKQLKEGIWPAACKNCELNESSGVSSMRTIWNKNLGINADQAVELVDPKNITYLDLTFETTCNSKCITCNPVLSSLWEKEYNHIFGTDLKIKRLSIDEEEVDKLIEDFPNVRRISFIGGEPLLSHAHKKYLNKLVSLNKSKNIKLNYVTNLTIVDEELIEFWEQFDGISLSVSVDGYSKVNDYMRYPIKWEKVEHNLRRYLELNKKNKNFSLGLSCTISALNFIYIPDFIEKFYDICREYGEYVSCFVNRVTWPENMVTKLLPNNCRILYIEEANKFLEKLEVDEVNNRDWIGCMKLFISMCEEEEDLDYQKLVSLKDFIEKSDQYRNRNIQDYMPEFWKILTETLKLIETTNYERL